MLIRDKLSKPGCRKSCDVELRLSRLQTPALAVGRHAADFVIYSSAELPQNDTAALADCFRFKTGLRLVSNPGSSAGDSYQERQNS